MLPKRNLKNFLNVNSLKKKYKKEQNVSIPVTKETTYIVNKHESM